MNKNKGTLLTNDLSQYSHHRYIYATTMKIALFKYESVNIFIILYNSDAMVLAIVQYQHQRQLPWNETTVSPAKVRTLIRVRKPRYTTDTIAPAT